MSNNDDDNIEVLAPAGPTDMTTELSRVVEENINGIEAGVFKREMLRLHAVEEAYVNLRTENSKLVEDHAELNKNYNSKSRDFDSVFRRENELKANEIEFEKKNTQLHIDTQLMALRLENANLRVEDHKGMVNSIFRSPVFTKSVIENRNYDEMTYPTKDEHGNTNYPQSQMMNDSKTTTTTESQD